MKFVPSAEDEKRVDVPYFEEVSKADGWVGHTTGKSIDQLRREVVVAIERLGGAFSGWKRGKYMTDSGREREGFQLFYSIEGKDGSMSPARMDIAALPCKYSRNREGSLKMALFMLRDALNGTRFLEALSPGYAPLMPWMLVDKERTLTQAWSESRAFLLPPPDDGADFIEAIVS